MNDKLLVIKLFEEIDDNDENSRRFKRDRFRKQNSLTPYFIYCNTFTEPYMH